MNKMQCCLMLKDGTRCPENGDFEIRENTRTDPDNFTSACEKHVGEMLGTTVGFPECKSWTVYFIDSHD